LGELTPEQKVEFARPNRNMPPVHEGSVIRAIWERYRGPDAPNAEPVSQQPDEFFRELIRRQYGSEEMLEHLNVERAPFLVQKIQMTKARARELYPGFDFDNE
jgi:hypothetical protein